MARSQALIQAGRHSLSATVAEAWESVQDGPRITGQTCVPMGLAASFALDAAVQAVDLLYASGGTTAFRDESPLQKRFQARAKGRGARIVKRSSHITVHVSDGRKE